MWKNKNLNDIPDYVLIKWEVFELTINGLKSRHFIGDDVLSQQPKVSSPIVLFDNKKMLGCTRFKMIYRLMGTPSSHPDASRVIHEWLENTGIACDNVEIISGDLVNKNSC